MSELAKRIAFAVPAAALFIWITWLGGWYFKTMMIGIGFFIQSEMIKILDRAKNPADSLFPYTIGLWVMLSQEISYSFEIGIGIFVLFVAIQTFNQTEFDLTELTSTVFAGLYAPLGILSLMMISSLGSTEAGFTLVMLLVFMVWGSDVFAYFGGKTFGKHALASSISPNKTWEGFFAGYFGSAAGGLLVWFLFPYNSGLSLTTLIPMTILVATFGPIGDLLESKLKRKAGVKDSSTLLPGHGGFFDRFDALILAAPATWVYLQILEAIGKVSF